jgi:hypothetical protein
MKDGIRRARRRSARGMTARRYGSRQMKVYMLRKERVCVGVRQERRRIILDWKTKTTPMRALKRRKLEDMVGREKEGPRMGRLWLLDGED